MLQLVKWTRHVFVTILAESPARSHAPSYQNPAMQPPQLTLSGIRIQCLYMDNSNMLKGSLQKECATFTLGLI